MWTTCPCVMCGCVFCETVDLKISAPVSSKFILICLSDLNFKKVGVLDYSLLLSKNGVKCVFLCSFSTQKMLIKHNFDICDTVLPNISG